RGGEGPAPDEDGETAEERLLARIQQVVTPSEGVPDCLLPMANVADITDVSWHATVQPRKQLRQRGDLQPDGDEPDCQQQRIQTMTDTRDERRILGREGEV